MSLDLVLSLLVLASIGLVAGAIVLWRRNGASRNVWLMLVLAGVMIANVLIWTVPDKDGTAPRDPAAEGMR